MLATQLAVSASAQPLPPLAQLEFDIVGIRLAVDPAALTVPKDIATSGAHAGALLQAFAEAVENDPALLLRWRGYDEAPPEGDPWRGGQLPAKSTRAASRAK